MGSVDVVESWLQTIGSKATTPEGKMYTAQLSSVIQFYNKPAITTEIQEVNWEEWSSRLNSKWIVDKVRENTESLLGEKYNVAAIAEKITSQPSEEYTRIVEQVYPVQ